MPTTEYSQGQDRSFIAPLVTVALVLTVVFVARVVGPTHFYVTEREWQTAITAWWMVADGHGLLGAITPLMGPPWQIPMELPLFQWLAAHLDVSWLGFSDAGRMLSLFFFLLSVVTIRRLALDLDLGPRVANYSAALFACSPLYLAYSFSYTIESLATFLGLLFLWTYIRWLRDLSITILLISIVTGTATALAKSTTWVVYAAAVAAIAAWALAAARRHGRSMWDTAVGTILVLAIPLGCGIAWVRWSDTVKSANPLTAGLTSAALAQWNFGIPELRLSATRWVFFALKETLLVIGPIGLLATIPAAILAVRSLKSRPPFPVLTASVSALLIGPIVFTNLYFVHDYYVLANGVFAILLLAGVLFAQKTRPVLLALLIASNLLTSGLYLALKQANYEDPLSDGIVRAVQGLPEDRTLVVFGSFLDARIPFESKHKALQTRIADSADPALREAVLSMRNQGVGAIVTRSGEYASAADWAAGRLGCDTRAELAPGVSVFYPPDLAPRLDLAPIDLEGEMALRLAGFEAGPQGRWGLLLPSGDQARLGFGLQRGGNTYLFDIQRGLRVIHRRWSPVGRGS